MAFAVRRKRAASAATPADSSEGSRYTDDADTIRSAFRHFRDQRTELKLQFEGDQTPYSIKVLDVSEQALLIEDIQPRDGIHALRQRQPFSLAGRSQGIYLYANELRTDSSKAERGVPYFELTLPDSVLYQQRRKSQRVDIPLRVKAQGARVRVAVGDQEWIGDILDLSAGGLRAQFCGQDAALFEADQPLDACVLHIRDQLDLTSTAIVRHAYYDARNQVFNCGLELAQMHVTDRRRLEHLVQSLARGPAQARG